VNIEEAIRDLGNELAELTGDNYVRVKKLEDALADARRDHTDLVGLVERMGRDLDGYITADYGTFVAASPLASASTTRPCTRQGGRQKRERVRERGVTEGRGYE